ncbi:DUF6012 family protein [Tepidicaulis marinus]|uniref:DUF6012 family protein n=1 Tax=Tepidicaulis marinus TaxID=1333998 RepID=UPI0005F00F83|nr:DUF6012 family protein [Tepidicaulis marinus]
MLIHLLPCLMACQRTEPPCALVDFHCDDLGLHLKGGAELAARRPYPNKNWLIACPHRGRKAIVGFFIETAVPLTAFTTLTRWKAAGIGVIEHEVRYEVLDQDFDALTSNMFLWYGTDKTRGGWAPRWPEAAKGWTPMLAQPRMELTSRRRQGDYKDRVQDGRIMARQEVVALHTVPRARLLSPSPHDLLSGRMPALESAFHTHEPA